MRIRVRLALALAALLGYAGCSEGGIEIGSGDGSGSERSTDTLILEPPDDETPGGSPSGDSSPAPSPGPDGSDAAPGGGTPDSDGSGGSDGGSGGSDGGSPGTGDHNLSVNDRGAVGSMGPALLRPEVPEIVIEIDATSGESMTTQARNALAAQADEHGNKQSVAFASGSTVPGQDVYSTADLRSLMEAHRAVWSTPDRAAVYVMMLSGRHENDGAVGIAFNASAYAIFPDQLSGGLLGLNYANFEEAVVVHELGHLYGLVNLTGHGAFHEDPERPGHSANDDSVMFWAVESTLVEDVFDGGPPRDFDADDEEEMRRIRSAG